MCDLWLILVGIGNFKIFKPLWRFKTVSGRQRNKTRQTNTTDIFDITCDLTKSLFSFIFVEISVRACMELRFRIEDTQNCLFPQISFENIPAVQCKISMPLELELTPFTCRLERPQEN